MSVETLKLPFRSLTVPNYRRYFVGQVISLSGNWMQIVAEMWLILKLTNSSFVVGLTAALQFVPMLVAGAWGGLLADRMPKRGLLMITQTLMAIPALTLWVLTGTGNVTAPGRTRARVRPRRGQRRRQPGAAELRDGDGRPRQGRQRGQSQQPDRAVRADHRPGRRRDRSSRRSASPRASSSTRSASARCCSHCG